MGLLDKIEGFFTQRAYRQEQREAAHVWEVYLQSRLAGHGESLAGRRVLISNEPQPGTREIAMILEYGLMRLGATVVTSRYDPYDYQVQIQRYSGTDAAVSIYDSAGNEIEMDIMHHEEAVAKAVGMLASQQ